MLKPDYQHSIVNLVTSLAGGQAPLPECYPPLASLSGFDLERRPLVLLIIDGLGYEYLRRRPGSFLARWLHQRLTSVFPTTTASAVTALALGVPALQHGIPGWFTYLRELGCVAAPLPFMPRGGGQGFDRLGVKARQLIQQPPLLPTLKWSVSIVSPAYISDSTYSHGLYGDLPRRPFRTLEEFFSQLQAGLGEGQNPLVWGYWTEFDGLAHQYGMASPEVAQHFEQLDAGFERFVASIAGRDALVLVTADHGLIDTDGRHRLLLDQHPDLQQMLRLPLCGEPRAAFCYLEPGAGDAFDGYLAEHFADAFEVLDSRAQAAVELFGCGTPCPAFAARIGDRVLIAKDNWIINDRLLQERPFSQIGVHGGLSVDELYVPLLLCEP